MRVSGTTSWSGTAANAYASGVWGQREAVQASEEMTEKKTAGQEEMTPKKTAGQEEMTGKKTAGREETEDERALRGLMEFLVREKEAKESGGGFRMKSTSPDESVGQLAAMLSRAETRVDVQQVSSKAMRAMVNLKMSSIACNDEKEKKKIAQMIKRMEKLMKRIQKKLQHLGKEEQLERRRKRAEKKQQEKKEEELRKELRAKRSKRRREERNYARKELAEDGKNESNETISALTEALSPGSGELNLETLGLTGDAAGAVAGAAGLDGGAALGAGDLGGAMPSLEGVSIDVTV